MGKFIAVFVAMLGSACFMWQSVNSVNQTCITYDWTKPSTSAFEPKKVNGTWYAQYSSPPGSLKCHTLNISILTSDSDDLKADGKYTYRYTTIAGLHVIDTECYEVSNLTRQQDDNTGNVVYKGTANVKITCCNVPTDPAKVTIKMLYIGCNCMSIEFTATSTSQNQKMNMTFVKDQPTLCGSKNECQTRMEEDGNSDMVKIYENCKDPNPLCKYTFPQCPQ